MTGTPFLFLSTSLIAALAVSTTWLFVSYRRLKNKAKQLAETTHALSSRLEEGSQSAVEEKNRLAAILESMAEGVLVIDTEQKILLINTALEKAFSFQKKDAVGRFFWEMFRDPEINSMMQTALTDRKPVRCEHEALLSEFIFEIQVSPVFSKDEFLGLVCVFSDRTLIKEYERLRTEFVANVSHELKTPLTSILGYVETLKEGGIDDKENRLKFLQIIEDQSKHLHRLIENLLYLSRFESAKEPLKLEKVDLGKMMQRMKETFTPLLKEQKLDLEISIPQGFTVMAEASSMERALSNLIDNAIKYNRPRGKIQVQANRVKGGVEIQVSDTGVGIPEHDIPRIFERFYRVDKSRAREHGGTGLGLSIVKHIVERHGGRVTVDSTPDKGTCINLFFIQ